MPSPVNSQFPVPAVEASQVVDSCSLSEEFAAPDEETTFSTSSTSTSSGVTHDNTVLVDPRCSSSLNEFAVPVYNRVRQELFDAAETTQEQPHCRGGDPQYSGHPFLELHVDQVRRFSRTCSILALHCSLPRLLRWKASRKRLKGLSMLTNRMMETPLPEPPMVEPPMVEPPLPEPPLVEPDRTSAKRRRRTWYTPVAGDYGTRSVPGSECVAAKKGTLDFVRARDCSRIETTWRKSGVTHSTTNLVLRLMTILLCSRKLFRTP